MREEEKEGVTVRGRNMESQLQYACVFHVCVRQTEEDREKKKPSSNVCVRLSGTRCDHPHPSCFSGVDTMDRGFFRKVDVPDHWHYIVAFFVVVIGALGVVGNALVIYAFFR